MDRTENRRWLPSPPLFGGCITFPLISRQAMMRALVVSVSRVSPSGWIMAGIGRLLPLVGLIAPPLAIVLQLQNAISLGQMLLMTVAAASAFWIGRIVEGYARQ